MPTDTLPSELHEHADPPSAPSRAGQDVMDNDFSLLDFLIALVERKGVIFKVTATFTILSLLISFILPKRYTATITLLPPQQNSSVGAALASQLGSLGGMAALAAGGSLGLKNPNDMYVAMLKGRTVEDAMVEHFGLMKEYGKRYVSDTRKTFEKRSIVDGSGKDGLIHISVEDRDPNRAAELANGYVDKFRELSEHLAITEASQRRMFFEQQLEQAKDNLANAEESLKRTEQTTGLIQLDSQARALIESAASLRAQIVTKEVQIEGMQTYATGENSQLVQAQRELQGLRSQLAKLGGSENGAAGEMIVPKGKVPEAGLEYVRKLRDVKYYETIFDILARQFEVAKLDEAKQGALIQVVDAAIPPDKPSFPRRGLMILLATLVGFLTGICVALVIGSLENLKSGEKANAKLIYLRRMLTLRSRPKPDRYTT